MYNTPKQSNSSTNIRHDQKKVPHNQGNKNSNYRKENRYEEYEDEKEQHYKGKGQTYNTKKNNNQNQYQTNEYSNGNSNGKKMNVGKRYNSNEPSYFIEYKGKEIDLGNSWKEMTHAIDSYFGKADMVFNLALKINVWDQLKDNTEVVVPKKEIDDILELYGKYRDRGY